MARALSKPARMVRSQSKRVEIFRSRTQHVFRTRVNSVDCLNSSITTPEYSLSHCLDHKDFSTHRKIPSTLALLAGNDGFY